MQMWNEINTEDDIDFFMQQTGCMHDAVIISLEFLSGCNVTEDRTTLFSFDGGSAVRLIIGSCWFGKIEMIFSGVKYFCSGKSADMWECSLHFRRDLLGRTRDDRLIVWTDGIFNPQIYGTKIEPGAIDLGQPADTCIIAYELKWRFIKDIEEAENACKKNNSLP